MKKFLLLLLLVCSIGTKIFAQPPTPIMSVTGNSINISNGDVTPSILDYTDFGTTICGTNIVRTFTISNSNLADDILFLGSPQVYITGPGASAFQITAYPSSPIFIGGSTTFDVTFLSNSAGIYDAIVVIENSDIDDNPYTFHILGALSDTTHPVIVTCPANVVANTSGGNCSATVFYSDGGAYDNCPGSAPPTTQDFSYTENVQSFTAPITAIYTLETWGAQGGNDPFDQFNTFGGKGGYARGDVALNAGETIYIYVGGQGKGNFCGSGSSGGGGSTDIRLVGGAWDDPAGLYSRIIVAGGGGGRQGSNLDGSGFLGNDGGGSNAPSFSLGMVNITGGTQFSGGSSDYPGAGVSLGVFGSAIDNGFPNMCSVGGYNGGARGSDNLPNGGAGGGWYGGCTTIPTGSGGSGFVYTSSSVVPVGYTPAASYQMINDQNIAGNSLMPGTFGGLIAGQIGHGYARISYHSSVTYSYNPPSGSTFPVGTTPVIFIATDEVGNSSTCTFNVTVNDLTPPVINCPVSIYAMNDDSICGQIVNYPNAGATDNCGISSFGPNLVTNPGAEMGFFGWVITQNFGNGWVTTVPDPHTGMNAFAGSYDWDEMTQEIDLVAAGYNTADLDLSPPIYVGEWFKASSCCSPNDAYYYKAELLDASNVVLSFFEFGDQPTPMLSDLNWQHLTNTFTLYPSGVRKVRITHGSHDFEMYPGNFGTIIDDAEVKVDTTSVPVGPSITYSYSIPSGSVFNVGTTLVTVTATDPAGNSSSCDFSVIVTDTIDPVLNCHADIAVDNDSGVCGAVVTYTQVATDCLGFQGNLIVNGSFETFDLTGWTAIDNPGISTPWSSYFFAPGGGYFLDAIPTDAMLLATNSFDGNAGVAVLYQQFTVPLIGSQDLSWDDNLDCKNFGFLDKVYTVEIQTTAGVPLDTLYEKIIAPGTFDNDNIWISHTANLSAFAGQTIRLAFVQNHQESMSSVGKFGLDHVSLYTEGPPTLVQIQGLPSGSVFPIGITTNKFYAFDAAGNTSDTCTFDVIVSDTEAPVVNCISDVTLPSVLFNCGRIITYTVPTTTDNCGSTIVQTDTSGYTSADLFPVGTTYQEYTATDGAGNTTVCSFNVIVSDSQFPIITSCPTNITVNSSSSTCDAMVFWGAPTGSDNCPGVIMTSNAFPGTTFPVGITTVTYTATDNYGNTTTCSFDVTVVDACLGISDAGEEITMTIYPNPSTGVFNLLLSALPVDNAQIRVLDALGQVLYVNTITSQNTYYDFSYLRAATYYIQVVTDEGSFTKQIIITHGY
jgi:hypothetical protein